MSSTKKRKFSTTAPSDKAAVQNRPVPVDWQAAPRAAQALRLRRLGYTYAQIAEQCGYKDESGARKVVKNATRKIVRDEAQELVGYQLDMLDTALNLVLRRIERDDQYSLFAVDRLGPLLKRQAELMGLDAPKEERQGAQMLVIPIAADVLEAV